MKNIFRSNSAGSATEALLNRRALEIARKLVDKNIPGFEVSDIADVVDVDPKELSNFLMDNTAETDECRSYDYALVFDVAPDDWKNNNSSEDLERIEIKVQPLAYNLRAMGANEDYVDTLIENAQKKVDAAKRAGQTARLNAKKVEVVKKDWFAIETLRMIRAIEENGLQVKVYRAWDLKKIVVLVGVGEYTLRKMAAYRQTDLEIDPTKSVIYARQRNFQLAVFTQLPGESADDDKAEARAQAMQEAGAIDEDDEDFFYKIGCVGLCCGHPTGHVFADKLSIANWEHIFVQYRQDAPQQIYRHYSQKNTDEETIFDDKTRTRLIYEALIADEDDEGCEFTFEEYVLDKSHPLIAVFPLADTEIQERLTEDWVKHWNPLFCPLNRVRAYLGEGPAFYFAFLQYYTKWLFIPGVLGPVFGVVQLVTRRFGFAGIELLSLVVVFWSVAFVDFWKRREATLRLEWGMTKYQDKAVARPQFKGDYYIDDVTGQFEETFGTIYIAVRQTFTVSIALSILMGAIACVFGVLFYRDTQDNPIIAVLMGVVNGVQIFIFDYIYNYVSLSLNEFENHRTQQDYENAKIGKAFFFRFINSFNSLFYISYIQNAFITNQARLKTPRDIMNLLRIQLITLFATAIVIQNAVEILFPIVWEMVCLKLQDSGEDGVPPGADAIQQPSPAEEQALKLPYEDTLQDMSEMVIQYGYVTLFVVAFPFTPTLAILNNFLEMKVDASNLVTGVQRPHLRGSYGLGVWNIILEVVGVVAVINNVALYTFLTQQGIALSTNRVRSAEPNKNTQDYKTLANAQQILFFVVISVILVIIVVVEKVLISDVPKDVERAIDRQRIIESVLVLRAKMGFDDESQEMMDQGTTDSQEDQTVFEDKIQLADLDNYVTIMESM